MNTQRISIGNIVRSILLIAIGIVVGVGISIGIGIGRIGGAPSWVSQQVDRLERPVVVSALSAHDVPFDVPVGRVLLAERRDLVTPECVVAEVVAVSHTDDVRGYSLLV